MWLRTAVLHEGAGPAKAISARHRLRPTPPAGIWAIVWKEIFAQPDARRSWPAHIGIGSAVTACFIPVALTIHRCRWLEFSYLTWPIWRFAINDWVGHVSNIMACLVLLQVTSRAAVSITQECDRQTFDTLLTTTVGSGGILFAKWLGSILSLRRIWCWLGSIGLIAYLLGG